MFYLAHRVELYSGWSEDQLADCNQWVDDIEQFLAEHGVLDSELDEEDDEKWWMVPRCPETLSSTMVKRKKRKKNYIIDFFSFSLFYFIIYLYYLLLLICLYAIADKLPYNSRY